MPQKPFKEQLLEELATIDNHEDAERILNQLPEGWEKGEQEMGPDVKGLVALMLALNRIERTKPGDKIWFEAKARSNAISLGIAYQKYVLATKAH